MAKLYFRYGAMGAGKTSLLLQSVYNYEERGMKTLVLKPDVDTKGEDFIISRIGLKRRVDHKVLEGEDLYSWLSENIFDTSCIFVDEAQFLEPKQVEQLLKIVVDFEVPVICYGLRTDFRTMGFPGAIRLLELAHSIEEMKTVCKCGRKAIFNARYENGVISTKGSQVVIDGATDFSYVSLCADCYYEG